MRSITTMASLAVLAIPLVSLAPSAHAQATDFMGQVQKFFNNDGDRDAYERGRQDEMRRQQAESERYRARRERERDRDRDWARNQRDQDRYGYDR